ncbi:polysaccharide biosynthesis protein [Natronospora cellulosivora (SeqCode)]
MLEFMSRIYKKKRLIIVDVILLNLALVLSFFIRFDGEWYNHFDYRFFIVISVSSFIVLFFSNLYKKIWKYASIGELKSIVKVSVLINLLLILYVFFAMRSFNRSILLVNFLLDVFLLGGSRFGLRLLKDHLSHQKILGARTRVLVIGAGDAGEIIIREMNKHPELKKDIIGLIDDDPQKINLEIHGVKVLGNRDNIPEVIKSYGVDEIVIAIPSASGDEIKEIYEFCNQDNVKVNIVPGMFEIINGDVNLSQIREVKVEDLLGRDQVKLNNKSIATHVENKTVLVTGAGGSIGSELCRQISRFNPRRVVMLDIYENNLYFLDLELREKFKHISFEPVIASIRDKDKLRNLFRKYKPEVVFHAAAHKHVPLMEHNPEEAVKNNIFGSRNLIEIADSFAVDRFVLISTDKAVNPTNVMGASKRVAEMFVQTINKESRTKFMAVRFGNVLGSQGSVIPLFKKQIAQGGPITVTHEDVTRYFMTIPEAVQLVIQAGSIGDGGEVFVLDMGQAVKIIDLAKDLIKLSGLKLGEDIDIEITGLRPGEKLYEELLHDTEDNIATEHERIFITKLNEIDTTRLKQICKELEEKIRLGDSQGIIQSMVSLVDTYKPNRDNIREVNFVNEKPIEEIAVAVEN